MDGTLALNGNQPTLAGTNQIHINSTGILLNTGATDAMQYHPTAIQFENTGILQFESNGGGTLDILDGTNFSIPNVILTGTKTKRIMTNIDGTNQVGHIDIQDANNDLEFDAAVTEISLSNGLSSIADQELIVNANTILDFNEAVTTFTGTITARDDSEVRYTSNATTIFSAEYYRLTINGNVDKTLTGSGVIVRDELSKGGNFDVDLSNTYLTLFSNQVYDGFLGTVSGNGDFTYSGTGRFILDKRVPVITENLGFVGNSASYFRDLTVPIQEATLENFKTAGITLYKKNGAADGFTDWGSSLTSILSYTEADAAGDISNTAFNAPSTTSDLISSAPHSGWKAIIGQKNVSTPYTFKDTGMVYTKNQTYTLSFTADGADNDAHRAVNNGWHLIGNPYPCTIDIAATINDGNNGNFMLLGEAEGILGTVWVKAPYDVTNEVFLDDNEDYPYAFYNVVTGVGNGDAALVPSHNSFWLKTFVPEANGDVGSFNFRIEEGHKVDTQLELRKSENKSSASPQLFSIRLLSNTSEKLGIVSFHEFPGASEGYNVGLDIEKFGTVNNDVNASIDFYSTQNLNLRVNAIGKKKATHSFGIDVKANAGNYALQLTGLVEYARNYGCAFLHDKVTNTFINLKDTTLSTYEFVVTSGEMAGRFTVDYNLSSSIAPFEFYNATCHNDNDGGIVLDLSNINGGASFDIMKDGQIVASVSNQTTKFKSTFAPGEYTIVDRTGNLACSVNQTIPFTIENPPLLTALFTTENNVQEGKPTTLINTSVNAEEFEWYFTDDMSYSTDVEPTHTFNTSGKHLVTLTIYQNDKKCSQQSNQYVYVNELTGVDAINNDKEAHFSTSGNTLNIEVYNAGTYQIHSIEGKQVLFGSVNGGKNEIKISTPGTYIITVFVGENTIREKVIIL